AVAVDVVAVLLVPAGGIDRAHEVARVVVKTQAGLVGIGGEGVPAAKVVLAAVVTGAGVGVVAIDHRLAGRIVVHAVLDRGERAHIAFVVGQLGGAGFG